MAKTIGSAPISMTSRALLVDLLNDCIAHQPSWWRDKMWKVDLLYYCMDKELAEQRFTKEKIEELGLDKQMVLSAPVIASQIGTAVAVLVDTFLSGYPLFGVLAPPDRMQQAEQVETLVAHYDRASGWKRHLRRFFRSVVKYGVAPVGLVDRFVLDMTSSVAGVQSHTGTRLPFICVPDGYNMLFDTRVAPADLAAKGDYVGYAEMLPMNALLSKLAAVRNSGQLAADGLLNLDKLGEYTVPYVNWNMRPVVRDDGFASTRDWDAWYAQAAGTGRGNKITQTYYNNHCLLRRMFYRIAPADYGLHRYGGKVPQVFEVWYYNDKEIIYFQPLYLPQNLLPIGQVDLEEDDFGYDVRSETELFAPFQRGASSLLTASVLGAERAVDDRALYDPKYISLANLTRASGSGYIPVTQSLAMGKELGSIYRSIPFDASAAFSMPQLIRQVVDTAQLLKGRNMASQGLPTKGNRTLGEFGSVQQRSDIRQGEAAMALETTAMEYLKGLIQYWITSHATAATLLNERTKQTVEIDPQTIRELEYRFSLTTGYFSKPSMASAGVMEKFLNLFATQPELAQAFDFPKMLTYLMSLEGVKDLDQFRRAPQQPQQPQQPPDMAPEASAGMEL